MTAEEISKLAGSGKRPSSEMDWVEKCLYWELRDTYARFKSGEITRSEGENLKREIVKRFEEESRELVFLKRLAKRNSEMWKEIEAATSLYNKEPSIENADAVIKALYRVGRKEMKKDG
jgi:hypothetical protein